MSTKIHGTIAKNLAAAQPMIENTLAHPEILKATTAHA
jgi:hypothetical protein